MINYIELITEYYPEVEVICNGDMTNYDNIVWLNIQIPKEELDIKLASKIKIDKITELSNHAKMLIIAGFRSDALEPGVMRHYDGGIEDQLNIAGATAVAIGTQDGFLYPSRDIETMTKSYLYHTSEQMSKVASDGAIFKLNILKRFNELKVYIMGLTEVSGIEWESEIQ